MDVEHSRESRPPILQRKVITQEGKRIGRRGIYDHNDDPVFELTEGEIYRVKIDGRTEYVRAGPVQRQLMYLLENVRGERAQTSSVDFKDPRVRATEANMKAAGFDSENGTYRY